MVAAEHRAMVIWGWLRGIASEVTLGENAGYLYGYDKCV